MIDAKIIDVVYLMTVLLFVLILRNDELKNRKLRASIFMLWSKNALKTKRDCLLAKTLGSYILSYANSIGKPNAIIDGEFISQCG
jgi:hypothetical protein